VCRRRLYDRAGSTKDHRARLYFPTWATFGRYATSSISEHIAYMMSTTEKAIDLDSIRQRLDRLGVRL
jgi:hypothetical protein